MGRGSYRGGSTYVGWNVNGYVAPRLTGRTRKGKALIRDLTARTAQSRVEQADQDALARKRHGLKSKARTAAPKAITSTGRPALADEARKRLKAAARPPLKVTVVRRRRRRPAPKR